MKRAVATDMATDMPRSMYAHGYLIRRRAPGYQFRYSGTISRELSKSGKTVRYGSAR